MADNRSLRTRIFPFRVTVPAGTTEAAPVVHPLIVPWTIMATVELTIPSGHVGVTGVAFALNGQRLLPWPGEGEWIIGDGQEFVFDTRLEVNTGLTAIGYNRGVYEHSFYVRLRLDDLPPIDRNAAPAVLLPL